MVEGYCFIEKVVQVVQPQNGNLSSHVRAHFDAVPLVYHLLQKCGTQVVHGGTSWLPRGVVLLVARRLVGTRGC